MLAGFGYRIRDRSANKKVEGSRDWISPTVETEPSSSQQPATRPAARHAATATTMMAKALVRDAPPAAMGLMDSAHGLD